MDRPPVWAGHPGGHRELEMAVVIPPGTFELLEPIGEGGMGQVWRGRHVARDLPVAVKLVTHEVARDPRYRDQFRAEVRAVARLDHPRIVRVHDHGALPGSEPLDARLPPGSPFLVMELARSSLAQHREPVGWLDVRSVLLQLLDALAHAHARGVVHRDLKPANVLIGHDGELLLTDFGIAHCIDDPTAGDGQHTSGTPTYMAPEQVLGRWRETGPWTDLYALGGLAWALVTGRPPFRGDSVLQTLHAKMHGKPEPFRPRVPVPDGFEAWVRALLARHPRDRVQRASDAAWALRQLGMPDLGTEPAGPARFPPATATTLVWTSAPAVVPPRAPSSPTSPVPGPPPFLPPWPRGDPGARALPGTGLGLFELRALPLVGRTVEREALWARLEQVRTSRRPRAVVLRGPAGVGKSRLAEWLTERSHEVGATEVYTATHAPIVGAGHGLLGMLQRALRCVGEDAGAVQERIVAFAPGVPRPAELAELIAGDGARRTGAGSARARWDLVRSWLAERSGPRVSLVHVDDAQWGEDALGFVEATLERGELPALFVITVRDENLSERPRESARLAALEAREDVHLLRVGKLASADARALVETMLGLAGPQADRVVRKAEGIPLFAVQLVGDWVSRGVLESGPDGFRLAPGASTAVPDSLHDLWSGRVARLLAGGPEDDGIALELAALLGDRVLASEWTAACRQAGIAPSADLLDRLVERGLAREEGARDDHGFRWAHGLLRESLERRVQEAGTAAERHAAVGRAVLEGRDARRHERAGKHFVRARRLEEALDPLAQGALARVRTGNGDGALRLLDLRDEAMRALRLPPDDVRWGVSDHMRASVLRQSARIPEGIAVATEGLRRAQERGDRVGSATLRVTRANLYLVLGRVEDAEADLLAAIHDRPYPAARLLLAHVHAMRGDLAGADALLEQVVREAEALDAEETLADALRTLAAVRVSAGRLDVDALLDRGQAVMQRLGNRAGEAAIVDLRGSVAAGRGALDDALAHHLEAERTYRRLGDPDGGYALYHAAFVHLLKDEPDAGRPYLEQALRIATGAGQAGLAAMVRLLMLGCHAACGEWDAWDACCDQALGGLAATGLVATDVPVVADRLAALAGQRGEHDRARRLQDLAEAQRAALARGAS